MNERKYRESKNQEGGMTFEEVQAKYGEAIKYLEFSKDRVYLLLGNSKKLNQQQLLWAGRALDRAGVDVLIAMLDEDALRVVELRKQDSKTEGERRLIYVPEGPLNSN